MTQGVSSFRRVAKPNERALKKLSERQDLPARVRHMLTGLLGLATGSLAHSLVAALGEFEKQLFEHASKSHTNEQCNRFFDSLREVKRVRADAAPRFLLAIEDGLARFDQRRHPGHAERARTAASASEELSLVETTDLEDSLALQEVATKCEVRQALMLHELGHRFGVLAGQRAFEADTLPLGPADLMAAVRHATAGMDIALEHRVLLYQTYERAVVSQIGSFYAALNAFLAEHRILRHLRIYVPLPARSGNASQFESAAASVSDRLAGAVPRQGMHAQTPLRSASFDGAQRPTPVESGVAPAAANAADAGKSPADAAASSGTRDAELFVTLRDLLASRRGEPVARTQQKERPGAYVPSSDAIQAVLAKLQSKPVIPAGDIGGHSTTQLKQDLLDQLRAFAPPGHKPQLNSEDADTIDLVGMLFDQIAQGAPAQGNTQSILTQLRVPLLRVALNDKAFFSQRSHPARELLNAIAETGIHWIDDSESEPDPALLHKLHTVVERLNSEFDGDLSLIEHMLGDLSQHMHKLARTAAVAERRLVDASKGREKLALARETAGNAIATRIAAAHPKRLLRTLLERAWTDVLALTLMSQGEKSEAYRKQLAVADQLIAAGNTSGRNNEPPAAALRREVEKGLSQVGYHKDEIHTVVKRLLTPETANEENPASQTSIALRIKSKAPLTDDERPVHAATLRKAALQLTDVEEKMLETLKHVPFGTWFEFAINQQGERVRRKLSWFSPLTGHCLFVNQRGERARECTLEQLARDIVRDQANILKPEQDSMVDRAWKAIVTSLRQLTGHGAGAPPLPA
jgi:Protein of unknown function (DUF1631)